MSSPEEHRHDRFLRLFTTAEPALRGFVRSLVPTVNDADDVLQEVAVTLWKKFSDYDGEIRALFEAGNPCLSSHL